MFIILSTIRLFWDTFSLFRIKRLCRCLNYYSVFALQTVFFIDLNKSYQDYSAGQPESLALMKNYFQNMGLPVQDNQVVMGTGFKNLYHTLLNVFMTKDVALDEQGRDLRKRECGTILVPRGHYQSLVKAPSWHNSRLKVIERMDGEHIKNELHDRGDIKALYFSIVANPSGEVMPEKQIR